MSAYSKPNGALPSESNLNFDVKEEVVKCGIRIKKGVLRGILIICSLILISLVAGDILRSLTGKPSIFYNDPITSVMFMTIPIFFGVYLYVVEMFRFKQDIGCKVFIKYTQNLVNKHPHIGRFKELCPDDLTRQLSKLRGHTYSQLDIALKEIVIYAVANEIYAVTWLFSDETLKKIIMANSNYNFHQIINNSNKVVSVKDKFIDRSIKRSKIKKL